jgi:hypothetical protein
MSIHAGLTTWIVRTRSLVVAYRWNMSIRDALRTLQFHRGRRRCLACGPLLVEW